MNAREKNDTKLIMIIFAIISFILLFAMIKNFSVIDCGYFFVVLFFAIRYLFLSR